MSLMSTERAAWRDYKAAKDHRLEVERELLARHSEHGEMAVEYARLVEKRARAKWIRAAESRAVAEGQAA